MPQSNAEKIVNAVLFTIDDDTFPTLADVEKLALGFKSMFPLSDEEFENVLSQIYEFFEVEVR